MSFPSKVGLVFFPIDKPKIEGYRFYFKFQIDYFSVWYKVLILEYVKCSYKMNARAIYC